jgi:HME family heavy-metal exporter
VNVLLNPGTSLAESNRIGTLAEQLVGAGARGDQGRPPHRSRRARRTCRRRALRPRWTWTSRPPTAAATRSSPTSATAWRVAGGLQRRPADLAPARPPAVRACARRSRSKSTATTSTRCAAWPRRCASAWRDPGVTDLQIEKQVLIPQLKMRLDYDKAARYGVAPGNLLRSLEQMIEGEPRDPDHRGQPALRPAGAPAGKRAQPAGTGRPADRNAARLRAVVELASVEESDGPNQISRENSRRRIVLSANSDGRDMGKIIERIRAELAASPLPAGYFTWRWKASSRRRSRHAVDRAAAAGVAGHDLSWCSTAATARRRWR